MFSEILAIKSSKLFSTFVRDGPVTWILPLSGQHAFANQQSEFHFEELQIYGNGHLAFMPPDESESNGIYTVGQLWNTETFTSSSPYELDLFFKYMIGDRTGTVHVGKQQVLDLEREEIDLPFNCYCYGDCDLGLAPTTFVHGVHIHMEGTMHHVKNLTLHHDGLLWMKHGGRTTNQSESHYEYNYVRYAKNDTRWIVINKICRKYSLA